MVQSKPKSVKNAVIEVYHWFRKFTTKTRQVMIPAALRVVSAFFSGLDLTYERKAK